VGRRVFGEVRLRRRVWLCSWREVEGIDPCSPCAIVCIERGVTEALLVFEKLDSPSYLTKVC
jgi:hypothetical protein